MSTFSSKVISSLNAKVVWYSMFSIATKTPYVAFSKKNVKFVSAPEKYKNKLLYDLILLNWQSKVADIPSIFATALILHMPVSGL